MEEKKLSERPSRKKLWIALIVLAVVVVVIVLSTTLSLLLNNGSGSGTGDTKSETQSWPGWGGIKNLAVFGDSMSNVGFSPVKDQPSRANPIGNPDFPGITSAIGANWVGFLTGTFNSTFIRTIDLGSGGATVSNDIFPADFPTTRSFEDQVTSDWQRYVPAKPSFDWRSDDTLFMTFFGLNDVRGAYFGSPRSPTDSVPKYIDLLGNLYEDGARNYLVVNITPLERAPVVNQNDTGRQEMGDLIKEYNNKLDSAVTQFSQDKPEASVFLFDTYKLFNQLLDDPCSHEETCAIRDTTTFCPAYVEEREDPYRDDRQCDYPVDKYFWINGIHCIWRVHKVMAKEIVNYLNDMS